MKKYTDYPAVPITPVEPVKVVSPLEAASLANTTLYNKWQAAENEAIQARSIVVAGEDLVRKASEEIRAAQYSNNRVGSPIGEIENNPTLTALEKELHRIGGKLQEAKLNKAAAESKVMTSKAAWTNSERTYRALSEYARTGAR